MSTSSSTNTGPNRFRADAASFSPQQPSNYGNYRTNQAPQPQQFYNPQHHQMYMNYGVPVYPYVIPPPQYYYNAPAEYYPPYPQQPYLGNTNNRKFNHHTHQNHHTHHEMVHPANIPNHQVNAYPGNVSRDFGYEYDMNGTQGNSNSNNTTSNNSNSHSHNSHGSHSNSTHISHNSHSPVPKSAQKPQPAEVAAKSAPEVSENSSPSEKREEKPVAAAAVEKPKKEEPKSQSVVKFPVYFNEDSLHFNEQYSQILPIRKDLIAAKYHHLNNINFDKLINIIPASHITIDYNSPKPVVPLSPVIKSPSVQQENATEKVAIEKESTPVQENGYEESFQSPSMPSTNWASILQVAPPSKKSSPIKAKSTNQASTNNTPQVITHDPVLAPSLFNISQESSQPLGILLLRIMFDGNYSIYSQNLPKYPITPHGLLNTGNICYMNSILQVLIFCQPFNALFKLIEDKSTGSLNPTSESPLIDATIKFFREFIKQNDETDNEENEDLKKNQPYEDTKPISPDSFYMNLISHAKFQHLKWGQQEDAEEFLGYYLDGLNEEFVAAMQKLSTTMIDELIQNYSLNNQDSEKVTQFKYNIKNTIKIIRNEKSDQDNIAPTEDHGGENEWNEVGANNKKISINKPVEFEPTPINQIFGGQFKSVLTIPRSSTSTSFQKSITIDPFQNVQLDISEVESIEQAFVNLNKLEKISYKSSNNQEVQIKKQTFIDKLPEILIIHLKRFSFLKEKEVGIEKLRKKINYNHELNIPNNLISNKSINNTSYRLTGVVYHHGVSAAGGHYTCDVLQNLDSIKGDNKEQEDWIRIDDTLLKQITENEVLNGGSEENIKNAYLLFYERV